MGLLPFVLELDETGIIASCAVGGCFLLVGIFNLWLGRRTSPYETVTKNPALAPVPAQIRYYRSVLWFLVISFPVMTFLVAHDLHRLESGAAANVRIYAPLQFIYEHFGYWPAVLSLPFLGAACWVILTLKIRKLTANQTTPIA